MEQNGTPQLLDANQFGWLRYYYTAITSLPGSIELFSRSKGFGRRHRRRGRSSLLLLLPFGNLFELNLFEIDYSTNIVKAHALIPLFDCWPSDSTLHILTQTPSRAD